MFLSSAAHICSPDMLPRQQIHIRTDSRRLMFFLICTFSLLSPEPPSFLADMNSCRQDENAPTIQHIFILFLLMLLAFYTQLPDTGSSFKRSVLTFYAPRKHPEHSFSSAAYTLSRLEKTKTHKDINLIVFLCHFILS